MFQKAGELCCRVNPIGICAGCNEPICVDAAAGHNGTRHKDKYYCQRSVKMGEIKIHLERLQQKAEARRKYSIQGLERKLSLVPVWQRRLEKLQKVSLDTKRIQRIEELIEEHGLCDVVYDAYGNRDQFAVTYKKEQVVVPCVGRIWTYSDGKISVEILRKADWSRMLLITVGKVERITNNILATLLKPLPPELPF